MPMTSPLLPTAPPVSTAPYAGTAMHAPYGPRFFYREIGRSGVVRDFLGSICQSPGDDVTDRQSHVRIEPKNSGLAELPISRSPCEISGVWRVDGWSEV
jgi:hypothetical protein